MYNSMTSFLIAYKHAVDELDFILKFNFTGDFLYVHLQRILFHVI